MKCFRHILFFKYIWERVQIIRFINLQLTLFFFQLFWIKCFRHLGVMQFRLRFYIITGKKQYIFFYNNKKINFYNNIFITIFPDWEKTHICCTRNATHRKIFSKYYWIKQESDRIHHFPIDLEPNDCLLCSKTNRK